jgi:hypothetical protein
LRPIDPIAELDRCFPRDALPRDLADVLHYFLPEIDGDAQPGTPTPAARQLDVRPDAAVPDAPRVESPAPPDGITAGSPRRATRPPRPPLPILGLPIGERDVARAALAWNLAIETTRLGGTGVLLAPDSDPASPLWPEAGIGPLGSEVIFCPARDLSELYAFASDLAIARAERSRQGGIIFVRIPTAWLGTQASRLDDQPEDHPGSRPDIQSEDQPADRLEIRPESPSTVSATPFARSMLWLLLLSSSNRRDLREARDLAGRLMQAHPRIEIGVTIHGANTISEARCAFETLARDCEDEFDIGLTSYGLLVDDLHVYRAIAAQRPIGLAHPQAPAARALTDVAKLLYEDARSRTLG